MHGVYMYPLAKRLNQAGFNAHALSYHSVWQSIDDHSLRLHRWLSTHHDGTPIHLVGHSLGGLVIRHFLVNFGYHWQIQRCVSLGTPHQGSICASYANRLLPPLVKNAYPNALDGTCVDVPHGVEFGVIAGTRAMGLGLPLLSYHTKKQGLSHSERQNDGTVYLSETVLKNATDYLVLPVSHTGLLSDKTVAHQVAHFLRHGAFER